MQHYPTALFSTYSIIAYDPHTGQLGGAVQTHQMSVGRILPMLLPGVGVVASQSLANIGFNPLALTMLREGIPPQKIIDALTASDDNAHRRQVAVLNAHGVAAAYTGSGCIPYAAHHVGTHYSVQANMMTRDTVIDAMVAAFEGTTGDLAHRMLAAMVAAQVEDGDIRGQQSAALKVVSGDINTPEWQSIYDLRVDESDEPVVALGRLVRLRHAQLTDNQGYSAMHDGKRDEALALWAQARVDAPELEELAFWQAKTLADDFDEVGLAAQIFNETFAQDARRAQWVDLLRRLKDCGLFRSGELADDLLKLVE